MKKGSPLAPVPRLGPRDNFRKAPDAGQAAGVELQPTRLRVPCEDCRRRVAAGQLASPFHPACGSHLP